MIALVAYVAYACIEVVVVLVSVLLASTDVSLRRMSNNYDHTVWGVAKYETRKAVATLRRDLYATLMTHKLISELTR